MSRYAYSGTLIVLFLVFTVTMAAVLIGGTA